MAAVGMAELSLDRDDPDGALPVAERLLRQHPLANRTQRVAALELAVRAKSAIGDPDGARVHLEELRSIAQAVPTSPLRAAAFFCDGVVAAAAGDHESAAVAFEDAIALFAASDAPYELGRARTELARSLAELGRRDLARREASAALTVLERTGASALRKRAQQVLDSLVAQSRRPSGPLTRRERQVLGLIAGGMRDGDIATALSLSQHTVHRHVRTSTPSSAARRARPPWPRPPSWGCSDPPHMACRGHVRRPRDGRSRRRCAPVAVPG